MRRRLGSLLLAVALLTTIAPAPVRATDYPPIPTEELTSTIRALRKTYGIPGVQVAIIYPDGRAYSTQSGFANVRALVRPVRGTPFAAGSVTKTFIAALFLQLAAEGRLSLDDTAATWLPDRIADRRITIRHLLQHTSGLYDFFSNSAIDSALLASKQTAWTPSRALSYVKAPWFAPGVSWRYSNTNYVLLGLIAQRVTGIAFSTLLRDRFFTPFRLTSAFVQGREPPRTIATAHAYTFASSLATATPIDQADGTGVSPFRSVTTAAGAAGAIAMSAWDMARWARALYGGRVLPPAALAELEATAATSTGDTMGYGLGTRTYSIGGYRAYGHNGRLIGAWVAMRYFPDLGLSIAVTTNQWRRDPGRFVSAVLPLALEALYPIPAPAPLDASPLPASPLPAQGS